MNPPVPNQVTELLVRWTGGDVSAREELIPIIYNQLRALARRCLAGQGVAHTLQSTALVHEAYLRLVKHSVVRWDNRAHFFAVAAQLMRRILLDQARMHAAAKRNGGHLTLSLDPDLALPNQRELDLIALDDALKTLAAMDSRQSQIVELRFFAGLSIEETAAVLEISPATVKREWATARLWLRREMKKTERA